MERYPNSPGPVLIYAGQAATRKDFAEAARRYQLAIKRDRRAIAGYLGAQRALRDGGLLDEAEAMLRLARRRFPRDQRVLVALAWNAHKRKDWPEAVRRWETLRKRFPMDKTGYIQGAEALRLAGRVADADALAAEAAARFPNPAAETAAAG
jgi:tetratricopeptide (TPR) repeat protein